MPGDRKAIKNALKLQYKVITDAITCSNFQHRHVYTVSQSVIKAIYASPDPNFAAVERAIRQQRTESRHAERQAKKTERAERRQSKRE